MQKEQQNKKITFAPAISTSYLLYYLLVLTYLIVVDHQRYHDEKLVKCIECDKIKNVTSNKLLKY